MSVVFRLQLLKVKNTPINSTHRYRYGTGNIKKRCKKWDINDKVTA
jgi:hypothetical protein